MNTKIIANKLTKKLKKLALDELTKLKNDIIIQCRTGYILFDKYKLVYNNDMYDLQKDGITLASFYETASAVAYCFSINKRYYDTARKIKSLDKDVYYCKSEYELYAHHIKINNNPRKLDVYVMKQSHIQRKLKQAKQELRKLIDLAKYYYS